MSYTINLSTGIVYRDSDSKQVAPAQSTSDIDYVSYIQWVSAGNSPKEVSVPVQQSKKITKLAFRNRFTTAEKIALEMASLDDVTASMAIRQQKAALRVYLKDLDNASFVDLDRADTIAGVNSLATMGLLTNERASEILNAPIQGSEVPQ